MSARKNLFSSQSVKFFGHCAILMCVSSIKICLQMLFHKVNNDKASHHHAWKKYVGIMYLFLRMFVHKLNIYMAFVLLIMYK